MLRQHLASEWIDLAERDRLETARALEPKAKAADTGEEVENAQHHLLCASRSVAEQRGRRGRAVISFDLHFGPAEIAVILAVLAGAFAAAWFARRKHQL